MGGDEVMRILRRLAFIVIAWGLAFWIRLPDMPAHTKPFSSPVRATYYFPVISRNYSPAHWREDFNNLEAWDYEIGRVRNPQWERQAYTTTAVTVANGILTIAPDPVALLSGSVFTRRTFTGGTFEIRAKLPTSGGCWPALWLLGDDSCCWRGQCHCVWSEGSSGGCWPGNGEIDIVEGWPGGWCNSTAHWGTCQDHFIEQSPLRTLDYGWHTWRLEWKPDLLVWTLDGAEVHRVTRRYTTEMKMIINLAMLWECAESVQIDYVEWWAE